ncbi:type VII secretion protein EsaA [Carnobacterium maltaromaticum]|uniref:type VII secretion protein EsaA n=1 Tax=Carnobacterium maltaromaticum TaxID=2751 RepID=UPI0039BE93F7
MRKKLIIGTLFFVLVIALGFSLTYMGLFTNSKADKEYEEQVAKMRIALVNEDVGTEFEGMTYSLGENYVKKIEKDANQNWYVVSRSIAESGLANDTYNLMIVVPSNFSSNTFSLNETAPEKAEISYKINANGNKDVENEAVKVAKNTIAELNKSLVDVYVSSILENLYTAQKNVGTVIGNQIEKIDIYGNTVYTPLEGYTSQFSTIQSAGDQSIKGIDQHKSVLTNYLESVVAYGTNQSDFDKNLQALITDQEKNQIDYLHFTESVAKHNTELGSEETQALYDQLVLQNSLIGAEFVKSEDTLVSQINGAESYISDVKSNILAQKAEVERQFAEDKLVLTRKIERQLKDQFGIGNDKISIQQLLDLDSNGQKLRDDLRTIKKQERDRINLVSNKISSLIYLNEASIVNSSLLDENTRGPMEENLKKIKGYIGYRLNSNFTRVIGSDEERLENDPEIYPYAEGNTVKQGNYQDLSNQKVEINTIEKNARYEQIIFETSGTISDYSILSSLTGSLTIPAEIKVTSATIQTSGGDVPIPEDKLESLFNPEQPLKIEEVLDLNRIGNVFALQIGYQLKDKDPIAGLDLPFDLVKLANQEISLTLTPYIEVWGGPIIIDPPNSQQPNTSIPGTPIINTIKIGFPDKSLTEDFDKTTYINLLNQYNTSTYQNGLLTGEYAQEYVAILTELNDLFGPLNDENKLDNLDKPRQASRLYNELINDTNSFNIFDILVRLMIVEPIEIYESYLTDFTEYEASADDMELKVATLDEKIVTTTETAGKLNEEVENQLKNLSAWQKTMNELEREEGTTDSLTKGEHSTTKQIQSELQSLMTISEGLKKNSESNIEDLKSVNAVFDAFNEDALAIQNSGLKVTKNTKDLMNAFQTQVDDTDNFSKTFNQVLKNGQQNGVINNQFVDFLAAPVKEKDNGRISSGDAYYPYLIIVALFITAVFTAYVLDLKVWQAKQVNNFETEDNLFIRNLPIVLFGLIAAIIEGIVIALISFNMQQMSPDVQLNWILVVVLVQIVFVLLASYLLRQFKMLGMFANLFLFAAYLLLTEAVGKALDTEAALYQIRNYSPLNSAESLLGNIANQVPNTFSNLFGFIILIPIVLILNLVVWFPKKAEVTEEIPPDEN